MQALDNINNVSFIVSSPVEFIYAAYTVAEYESIVSTYEEEKVEVNIKFKDIVENMRSRISRFLKNEFSYFFESGHGALGGIGFIACRHVIITNPDIGSVNDLLTIIEETPEPELFNIVVKLILQLNRNKQIEEICNWDAVGADFESMITLVNDTIIEDSNFKEKILECLENPSETKLRLSLMLSQFYEKFYQPIETEVLSELNQFKISYEKAFSSNPERFTRQYLHTELSTISSKHEIHISFFRHTGYDIWINRKTDRALACLGAFSDQVFGDEKLKENTILFFKTLSDRKRIDIIDLLTDRAWYVYELAEKLNMSSATISYHLGMLLDLGIVHFERYDHRIYYSLNKDKLKELSDNAIKNLLRE